MIGRFPLSHLLLMLDAHYPWCILVPEKTKVTEIYQLDGHEQQQLLKESSALGQIMMEQFRGDKLNIGALGNMVPQLHVHHVIRYKDDPSWPNPVWGQLPAAAYQAEDLDKRVNKIQSALLKAEQGFIC